MVRLNVGTPQDSVRNAWYVARHRWIAVDNCYLLRNLRLSLDDIVGKAQSANTHAITSIMTRLIFPSHFRKPPSFLCLVIGFSHSPGIFLGKARDSSLVSQIRDEDKCLGYYFGAFGYILSEALESIEPRE